jgi:predicted site-specific integrase-resolvase
MSRFIKIGKAAEILGVSIQTLRRWEELGQLTPDRKSSGHTRYYDLDKLLGLKNIETDVTIAYARVSSHDQKQDLTRQAKLLSDYCTSKGWNFEVIQDLGSGMNYQKKGLKRLLDLILEKQIRRLVLTHKDRLLRFGAELVFALCEARKIEVVIINQGDEVSFEEELTKDVPEIITVFSARLYGARSHKNKKLVDAAKVLIGNEDS